jgi:Uma2 family endonuclease
MVTKDISQTEQKTLSMSFEEFLAWADEDTHAEWVDGEVIVFMPAKDIHQAMVGFLYQLITLFVDLFQLGKTRVAPLGMRLEKSPSMREPDILFVANAHLDRLTPDRLEGGADLVIEVISDDSVYRDRQEKFKEYEAEGIPEYWIIDPRPNKQRADFFRLNEQGEYELFATEDDEPVKSAVLPKFWLKPDWLWQADTLSPLTAFAEVAGLPSDFVEQLRQQTESG